MLRRGGTAASTWPGRCLGLPGAVGFGRRRPQLRQANHGVEFRRPNRLDAEPGTASEQLHLLESRNLAQLLRPERSRKLFHEADVDHLPDRVVGRRLGIEVIVLGIPGGVVGIGSSRRRQRRPTIAGGSALEW